ncbi:hypothetical protein TIFTF001_037813 [Ficus carica]|uniref:Uncharacterized protein n=1 Tax=Ficus carica TaxID=3494 RepID=A0AA88EAG0_FICCA|nr:hypothetical protein TIFTF001_037813 [Ficus carica]
MFLGPSLPANVLDDLVMEAFCRSSVVDGDFLVIGINSLRVVDGFTFNMSHGTKPQSTLTMFGLYISLKMMRERNKSE